MALVSCLTGVGGQKGFEEIIYLPNTVALLLDLLQWLNFEIYTVSRQVKALARAAPDDEQGEFQGGMTGLISLTAIIGPFLMTNLFSYFTSESTYFYFPGAPFMLGAVLSIFGLVIAIKFLSGSKIKY